MKQHQLFSTASAKKSSVSTKLVAIFKDSIGKKHCWTYKDVNTRLSPQKVKDLLDRLAALELFEKDGVKLFAQVVSAKFVTTIETVLFDSKDNKEQPIIDSSSEKKRPDKKMQNDKKIFRKLTDYNS